MSGCIRRASGRAWRRTETLPEPKQLTYGYRMRSRYASTLCIVLFASTLTFAADYSGFIRDENCPADVALHLHLKPTRNKSSSKIADFYLPYDIEHQTGIGWIERRMCVPNSFRMKCDKTAMGKIQILSVSMHEDKIRKVSGNFSVTSSDGKTYQGSFEAKGHRPGKKRCD